MGRKSAWAVLAGSVAVCALTRPGTGWEAATYAVAGVTVAGWAAAQVWLRTHPVPGGER